jgi:AcrR family transcriptional regulator
VKAKAGTRRDLLIAAAAALIHKQGYHRTTLSEIAKEAKIPLGIVYYYFKTKDSICEAVVLHYLGIFQAHALKWDGLPSPQKRLNAFIDMIDGNSNIAAECGCPFGTLASEIHKQGGGLARKATLLFSEPLKWIESQLREMVGGEEAAEVARHILAVWQGSLMLAYTFHDKSLVAKETTRLRSIIVNC